MELAAFYGNHLRKVAGDYANEYSESATMRRFNVTRGFARYWAQKREDPDFHPGKHGGVRNVKFPLEQRWVLESILYQMVLEKPLSTLHAYRTALSQMGIDVSETFIDRILHSWRYSKKAAKHRCMLKFTPANMQYYAYHTYTMLFFPWRILKFCDETHFDPADLQVLRGWSEEGRGCDVAVPKNKDPSYSMTVTSSLTNALPIYCSNPRRGSNTARDFLVYVILLVGNQYLVAGDIFIVDNASIHHAAEIQPALHTLFAFVGCRMAFLPTFSPELNPCELIFAMIKNYIRQHRGSLPLLLDIVVAAATVTRENVIAFYRECIDVYGVIPA